MIHHLINRLSRRVVRLAASLPMPVLRLIAGAPVVIEGKTLDPQAQAMLRLAGVDTGKEESVQETRDGFDAQGDWLAHAPAPGVTEQAWYAGGVPCAVFRGPDCPAHGAPAVVFYHGGGHVAGSIASHRPVARQLAAELGAVIVLVAHRMAPEHKFPAGISDCLTAYDAVIAAAGELGIDPARVAVAGDSAGGNAAAVVAQQRKEAPHPPCYQMLWSPWLDMSRETKSFELFAEGFFLEREKIRWYTAHYLEHPEQATDPMVSPLLGDVRGTCPAAVMVAGFDPLRDEGLAYAEALRKAGVETEQIVLEGMVHPWVNLAGKIHGARAGFDQAVAILHDAFERPH